ncbi:hypothetical protein JCM4814A_92090 [Streptomyces phaeofaciens JCM 4814]|uniref:Uncharacterized protein n=1 Tax=Streptomyces phaeofaciens TaxID=68254 RepID=A0A918LXR0_9ACTN|nr:hypothetical protein GCM10010226_55440 [Streptomyces phaeofaciens]
MPRRRPGALRARRFKPRRPHTAPAREWEYEVLNEDIGRLSPLRHANLNCPGRCGIRAAAPADGGPCPLRDGPPAMRTEEAQRPRAGRGRCRS